nr:aminodeoxychorismate synthase component I [Dongshaea marina]
MLLESAAADHPDSRYHIITADPLATLTTYGQTTRVRYDGIIEESAEDPLQLLQAWQHQLLGDCSQIPCELPFFSGAMGLWSYDLGRRFESLPQTLAVDDSAPDMAVGIYDWAIVIDRSTGKTELLQLGGEQQLQARYQWWQQQITTEQAPFALSSQWHSNMSYPEYQQKFTAIEQYLKSGDCYQINLTQRFSARYRGCEWQAYCLLSEQNRAPFSAFIRLDECALLSISPERFIAVDDRHAQTKPIKGTRPRGSNPVEDRQQAEWLLCSTKDKAENLMIVDLLRNDFSRACEAGSVKVPILFGLESFPAVHHLVSTVTGTLAPGQQASDLLRACFPGGSITGAPKIRAMEIIEELEPTRRSVYCGSIGYISAHGRMDTSITIRTLLCHQQVIHCWVGGGIVADSTVEEEFREAEHKVAKILPLLSGVNQSPSSQPLCSAATA